MLSPYEPKCTPRRQVPSEPAVLNKLESKKKIGSSGRPMVGLPREGRDRGGLDRDWSPNPALTRSRRGSFHHRAPPPIRLTSVPRRFFSPCRCRQGASLKTSSTCHPAPRPQWVFRRPSALRPGCLGMKSTSRSTGRWTGSSLIHLFGSSRVVPAEAPKARNGMVLTPTRMAGGGEGTARSVALAARLANRVSRTGSAP